jgi:predicted nucleotidyltransferase
MEKELTELVESLKTAHGENLVSVVLYGSAVIGNHVKGRSNLNVLVVLERITLDDLRAAHPVVEKWRAKGQPLPLYFTGEEMSDASDVFPIEFLDMAAAHRVLHGDDPLAELNVPTVNLRHQLEYELRGKLIRLRELYIQSSKSAERLSALMADSIASFALLFKHVLSLVGVQGDLLSKREVVDQLQTAVHLNTKPFVAVLEVRDNNRQLSLDEATGLFAEYLTALEQVTEVVDSLEVKT